MASSRWSSQCTLRKVACCPANDASGRSSAVAEERTATYGKSLPAFIRFSADCPAFAKPESIWNWKLYVEHLPKGSRFSANLRQTIHIYIAKPQNEFTLFFHNNN